MNKKTLLSTLFAFLLFATISASFAHPPSPTDPTTLIIDTISEPETVDPAWAYDLMSSEVIQNVYEPLAFYMVDRRLGPYEAGLVDVFTPKVAKSWQYVDIPDYVQNGITITHRFYFEINVGIPFHPGRDGTNWGTLTTEDVEYSFERGLVQDRDGGPQWMIYEFLLDVTGASPPWEDPLFGLKIDHSVDHNSTHVWFNMAATKVKISEVTILQRTAYCGGIVCKDWAVSLGDFDGNWAAGWEYIWDTWHNPPVSFIEGDMIGTGPYKFSYRVYGYSWSITKFDDYWGGWPSLVEEDPGAGDNRLVDDAYITTVIWYYYPSWPTREARFLNGDSDETVVPLDKPTADYLLICSGIRCFFPIGPFGGRHWERDWNRGWYHNPKYSGGYYYHRWKAVTHFGDCNNDGHVNILDKGYIAGHWTGAPGTTYNPCADINGGIGGKVCGGSGPVVGIADGLVDIMDLALLNPNWDQW